VTIAIIMPRGHNSSLINDQRSMLKMTHTLSRLLQGSQLQVLQINHVSIYVVKELFLRSFLRNKT
jgi:hypothetical protein